MMVNSPGVMNSIRPPHVHISVEVLSKVGWFALIPTDTLDRSPLEDAPGRRAAALRGRGTVPFFFNEPRRSPSCATANSKLFLLRSRPLRWPYAGWDKARENRQPLWSLDVLPPPPARGFWNTNVVVMLSLRISLSELLTSVSSNFVEGVRRLRSANTIGWNGQCGVFSLVFCNCLVRLPGYKTHLP
jgi:hypothetical protein